MEENKKKKIVYVDMDNVLVDFRSGLSRVTNAILTGLMTTAQASHTTMTSLTFSR